MSMLFWNFSFFKKTLKIWGHWIYSMFNIYINIYILCLIYIIYKSNRYAFIYENHSKKVFMMITAKNTLSGNMYILPSSNIWSKFSFFVVIEILNEDSSKSATFTFQVEESLIGPVHYLAASFTSAHVMPVA